MVDIKSIKFRHTKYTIFNAIILGEIIINKHEVFLFGVRGPGFPFPHFFKKYISVGCSSVSFSKLYKFESFTFPSSPGMPALRFSIEQDGVYLRTYTEKHLLLSTFDLQLLNYNLKRYNNKNFNESYLKLKKDEL